MGLRLGVDLGGTKTEIVALGDDGSEILRRRLPTPRGDYLGTVTTIATLVAQVENELQERGTVGVGIPGAISSVSGCVKNANSTWLIGRPLQHDLEAMLQRQVRVANDANCFALSEATDGAAVGAEVAFGVILGTGVGGGVVVHGRVMAGANRIAGEWGHNPLPGDGLAHRNCYCGRHDCVETFLSAPGLQADHLAVSGEACSSRLIVARAAAGDAACEATLARYEARLAQALAQVINILDPDVIVLGGGLSNIARLYDNVPKLWGPHIFSDDVATRLVANCHGDSSGVRGAARLWNAAP
jgi:predicted NBD/HSP70 family sugar kinase